MTEVKPCPFCDGAATKTPRFCMGYAGDGIVCQTVGCKAETPKHLTGVSAITWWNK